MLITGDAAGSSLWGLAIGAEDLPTRRWMSDAVGRFAGEWVLRIGYDGAPPPLTAARSSSVESLTPSAAAFCSVSSSEVRGLYERLVGHGTLPEEAVATTCSEESRRI